MSKLFLERLDAALDSIEGNSSEYYGNIQTLQRYMPERTPPKVYRAAAAYIFGSGLDWQGLKAAIGDEWASIVHQIHRQINEPVAESKNPKQP